MAKQIALSLTINGVKQNITNINQLEKAIKEAEGELKNLAVGSEAFKSLSTDVKNAKNQLEDFNESIKGQDLEKRVGSFAKVGEGITASFAGAQAAISLFGEESEAVAEAAAKAQSVLTIALAARSAAESVVAVRTVAANIATAASTLATNAANAATKAFYATLAANPYGAILAVIGLVVAALVTLTSKTQQQVNVQKELATATSDEANSLKTSLTILTQFNGQRELQRREIEKLKKEYPGFNAFIDKENRLNQRGVEFLKLKIRQYQLEAQAKLLTQKIAENSIKILEIESTSILENVSFWEKAWNTIRSGGVITEAIRRDFQTGLENIKEQTAELTQQNEIYTRGLTTVFEQTDEVLTQLKSYNQQLETQDRTEKQLAQTKENSKKLQEEINNAYKKSVTGTIDLSKAIQKLNDSLKQYEETIKELDQINYNAAILEQLNEIKNARQSAAQQLVQGIDEVKKSLLTLKPDVVPLDPLIDIFEILRTRLEDEFNKLGTTGFKGFQTIYEDFVRDNNRLNQEQKKILADLIQGYEDLSKFLIETPGFIDYINTLKNVNVEWDSFKDKTQGTNDILYNQAQAFAAIAGEITAANNKFLLEFKQTQGGIAGVAAQIQEDTFDSLIELKFDPIKARANAEAYIKEIENALFKPLAVKLLRAELDAQRLALTQTTDAVRKAEIQGFIDNIVKQIDVVTKTGQFAANLTQTTGEQVRKEVEVLTQTFLKLADSLVTAEQKILLVNKEFDKLKKSLTPEELSRAIGGTILQNIDTISNLLLGVRTQEAKIEKDFIDKVKADRAGLEKFKKQLIDTGLDVEKASYDDLLAAFIAYKRKEVDVNNKAEDEKKKAQQTTLSQLERGFQIFSQTLNQISAVTQERARTDLQSLQIAEKAFLDRVVGDSETAQQKRLEIQKEYAEKRKQVEKQAAISQLKFSLVQAIAQAAQSVVNILQSTAIFGPAAPFIAAGLISITAGLTAAQISIIQDQISNAQAMRRGGLLRAQSGMLLQGPSHEQGGIPLAQMGIVAEGNEAIINRQSSINFRDLLSTINQNGGGRPLVVNNFDDSRIVEALAKQKQTPIRAYVLGSDITNEQQISARLDNLSKF